MKKLFYSCTTLALLSVVWFSCRKAITIDDTDRDFPIQLSATIEGDSVVLSWNLERTVQFQRLIVVRTPAPIDKGLSPFNLPDVKFILDSGEDDIEQLVELKSVYYRSLYYKVYVQVGAEKFIESNSVVVNYDGFSAEGFPTSALAHPDSNWVVVVVNLGNQSTQISLINLDENKVMGSMFIPRSVPPTLSLSFKYFNEQAYLMVMETPYQYSRYQLPTMVLSEKVTLPYPTWSVLGARSNDFVFMTHENAEYGMTIRKVEEISTVTHAYERQYQNFQNHVQTFLDASQNKILEICDNGIQRLRFTTDGALDSTYSKVNPWATNNSMNSHDIVVAPGGKYFIMGRNRYVYNENLDRVAQLYSENGRDHSDYCFSPDGKYLYALVPISNPTLKTKILKFKVDTWQVENTLELNDLFGSQLLFNTKNELILFSNNGMATERYNYKIIEL